PPRALDGEDGRVVGAVARQAARTGSIRSDDGARPPDVAIVDHGVRQRLVVVHAVAALGLDQRPDDRTEQVTRGAQRHVVGWRVDREVGAVATVDVPRRGAAAAGEDRDMGRHGGGGYDADGGDGQLIVDVD